MSSEENKQQTPGVISRPFNTVALQMPNGLTFLIFVCPFCYSNLSFPPEIFKASLANCQCGAKFSTLGSALKYVGVGWSDQ